uniref:Transcription initiation factor IIE subunit beta n=1 Tax=Aceria tosichella TaxID=561515 RepID=A0A6G1SI75_9ACAR
MSNVAETLAAAFGRSYDPSQTSYKTMTALSQNNFSLIAKIVNWLKERHLSGDSEPLTLDEILEETENTEISVRTKNWLENEVLENNPRVRVLKPEGDVKGPNKYQFKPLIDVKDRKTLRKYLMDKYQAGEGAVWMDDVVESMPNANRAIKWLMDNDFIVVITRQLDKKKIIFYNEGKQEEKIDDEFVKLWRSISVDGVADDKIEEYLEKHGIKSIQDLESKKMEPTQKRRKIMRKPNKNFKAHNDHMKGILEDYAEK